MPSPNGWFRLDVPVRFRDLDSMGHAHHTLPLIYLEEARAAFWRELRGNDSIEAIDYVMAEVTVRFHSRILYPSTVAVALHVTHIGTKSFKIGFEIRAASDALLSSGSAVQVMYRYSEGRPMGIDEELRAGLSRYLTAGGNES